MTVSGKKLPLTFENCDRIVLTKIIVNKSRSILRKNTKMDYFVVFKIQNIMNAKNIDPDGENISIHTSRIQGTKRRYERIMYAILKKSIY